MEDQEQQNKSRVVKVDSAESWDFFVSQANNRGCPIVVHFTASWCMPSVAMNSFFEELASTYPDVLFLSVDVDDVKNLPFDGNSYYFHLLNAEKLLNIGKFGFFIGHTLQDVASKMEVKAMPTFLLMREGATVDKLVGANPEEIRKRIDGFVQSIRVYVA